MIKAYPNFILLIIYQKLITNKLLRYYNITIYMDNRKVYKKNFTVKSYEADINLKLKINCLLQWFSDISWEHANNLGLGFESLSTHKLHWALVGYNIFIYDLPKWKDNVIIETWTSGISGLQYGREYKLLDLEHNCLAAASSSWIIFDEDLSRPVTSELAQVLDLKQIPKATEDGYIKLRPFKDCIFYKELRAEYTDIDLNRHVNNAVYMRWIEDIYKEITEKSIKSIKIQYIDEVKLHQKLKFHYSYDSFLFRLEAMSADNKCCMRAEIHTL